ncbi:MAG: hypothetical protein A4E62_00133 [Syntrophorhabdus sp. PtaU1.Bin002]|nr:MAG: hypothetical protein A4E58_00272 [Syntrophorhabdus sp. PtaB.Bin006]OPY73986.1 MAG: hypothetical protein A4E62_00133 [Syntrophorhabdus sp. PtaU1.Bin002]
MTTRRVFGVKHCGVFFHTLLIIEDNTFFHKDKQHKWTDIVAVKRDDGIFSAFMRYPSTTILLNDGSIIRIPAILEERKGGKRGIQFSVFDYTNKAYDELIHIIETKTLSHSLTGRNLSELLCSINYIMFYRFLISMCLLFGTIISFFLFVVKTDYDAIMLLMTIIPLIGLVTGLCMLIKKRKNESRLKAGGMRDAR